MLGFKLFAVIGVAPWLVPMAPGILHVRVSDSQGEPLPGAQVRVTVASGEQPRVGVSTDALGIAAIEGLPIGVELELIVTFPGFAPSRIEGLVLSESRAFGVTLEEESVESVQLWCRGPMVDLDRVGHSTLFSAEFLADLPGGRSAAQIEPPPRGPRGQRAKPN